MRNCLILIALLINASPSFAYGYEKYIEFNEASLQLKINDLVKQDFCSNDHNIALDREQGTMSGIEALVSGMLLVKDKINNPLDITKNLSDSEVEESFKRLIKQVESSSPSLKKILSAMSDFEKKCDSYGKANDTALYGSSWIPIILAKYASKKSLALIFQNAPCFSTEVIQKIFSYAFMMDGDNLDTISNYENASIGNDAQLTISDINSYISDVTAGTDNGVREVVVAALNYVAMNRSRLRNGASATNDELLALTKLEKLLSQLQQLSLDPSKFVCNKTEDSSMHKGELVDWCKDNDPIFKKFLEFSASQANDVARYMKDPKNGIANLVTTSLGSASGTLCKIEGVYHLRKNGSDVLLTTNANLIIKKNNQRVQFTPIDLYNAINNTQKNMSVVP